MDNIHIDVNRDKLEDVMGNHPDASWLVFSYDKKGDGTKFTAEIHHPKSALVPSSSIIISHEALDAYIYGLQDMKQRMQLIRDRHET